ncbi:hypothetical protein [Chloroflexus sp.]|uniref:hypothetical protein n=1 Tax=Chloroflexus sp. TaxID=1904827 RepID=UPI002ADE83B1|nr:hypothetical protein [Chloroflexus sp.]
MTISRYAFGLRVAFAAGVMVMLVSALWAGLLRIGWALPFSPIALAALHGQLFVGGMLGTVIGLERAVAIGRPWAFAGPLLTLSGGLGLLLGLPTPLATLLISSGSFGLLIIFATLLKRQPAHFLITMALGGLAWFGGNLIWLSGKPLALASLWWIGFLTLTIFGERLELGRLRQLPVHAFWSFSLSVGLIWLGLLWSLFDYVNSSRIAGLGLLGSGLWLLAYDIGRRTIRRPGLPRFSATCMLSGSAWLAIGGLLMVVVGGVYGGFLYDAILHSVFVGFVSAMIFGHAPIIIPALLKVPLHFSNWSYLPLGLLHLSLVLRVFGDLLMVIELRRWGGMLNAVSIVVFLLITAGSVLVARRQRVAVANDETGVQYRESPGH